LSVGQKRIVSRNFLHVFTACIHQKHYTKSVQLKLNDALPNEKPVESKNSATSLLLVDQLTAAENLVTLFF